MRLTILNQFYPPDIAPTGALAESLAEHRTQQGDEVTVVASRGGYVQAHAGTEQAHEANPRVLRVWTPQLGKASLLRRCTDYAAFYLGAAWRMLRLPRQDVIVALTTPPLIAYAAAMHKILHPSTRLILWNMDCYPEVAERVGVIRSGGLISRIMRALNRALFRRLDHLICLDSAMRSLLLSQYAPKRRSLPAAIIPCWEKLSFYPPGVADLHPSQKAERGLNGRLVVLYSGNMGCGHRFETVIEAAEALRQEPVTFLLVGRGAQRSVLEEAKRDRCLDNVLIEDYVPRRRLRNLLATADCALITLRDEMLGVMSPSKLHANLAMGRPIVYLGPQTSNVDEAISRFDCGAGLRHGDVAGLVDFIRAAVEQPGRLKAMGHRARAAFDQMYCDRRTLPQIDAVIDAVAIEDVPSQPGEEPRRQAA